MPNRFFTSFLFLILSLTVFSQQQKLKEYSHTEFFKLISAEKDSIFKLKDAFIAFTEKDSAFFYEYIDNDIVFNSKDTIVIDKEIELTNVHFEHKKDDIGQALQLITFTKDVRIYNTTSVLFYNCIFKGSLEIDTEILGNEQINIFDEKYTSYEPDIGIFNSVFHKNLFVDVGSIENYSSIGFNLFESDFVSKNKSVSHEIYVNNIRETNIDDNLFKGNGFIAIHIDTSTFTSVFRNDFNDYRVDLSKLSLNNAQTYLIEDNIFNRELLLNVDEFSISHVYRWNQWENKVLSTNGFDLYLKDLIKQNKNLDYNDIYYNDTIFNNYKNKYRFELENSYKFEMQLLGQFYDFYKLQHDADFSNKVYIEFKDLETKRYAFLYKENPTFNSFFTWKINQFLHIFSAYGTNPSLSIVFSLYVILFFAIIYMLFPNNWESGKKNKLMNRLKFFTQYFRRQEGIREIYEEEKQHDLMTYKEFKDYMMHSKKEIPIYFIWLTRPIYYFSSYNYKLTGRVLKHTDILKGRWVDLPKRKKITTSIIMAFWIVGLIFLDVLIKFLNALTLSINTFTTLGFGEIPIKGIPRYLAVIQGFIGWFMLTIFSVSLISQLLN